MAGLSESVSILINARNNASGELLRAQNQLRQLAAAAQSVYPAAAGAAGSAIQAFTGLASAAGPVAVAAGAAAAALGSFGVQARASLDRVRQLAGAAEQLDNLRQATGLAIEPLQGLQLQLREGGISSEALGVGLRTLNRNIGEGSNELKRLGITTQSTEQALRQIADLFAALPDGPNKTRIALELLGRSGTDLIPILNQGSGALAAFTQKAVASGVAITTEQLPSLLQLDKAMDDYERTVEGLQNRIALGLVPALTAAAAGFDRLVAAVQIAPSVFKVLDSATQARVAETLGNLRLLFGAPGSTEARDRLKTDVDAMVETVKRLKVATTPTQKPTVFADLAERGRDGADAGRERRLEEIKRALGQTRVEAERTLHALEAIEQSKKAAGIRDTLAAEQLAVARRALAESLKLPDGKPIVASFASALRTAELVPAEFQKALAASEGVKGNMAATLALARAAALAIRGAEEQGGIDTSGTPLERQPTGERPGGPHRRLQPDEPVEMPPLRLDELTAAKEQMRALFDEMVSAGEVWRTQMEGIFGGINAGFQTLASQILQAKIDIVAIVKSMVAEIWSAFARLAAIKLFAGIFLAPATGGASAILAVPGVMEAGPTGTGGGGATRPGDARRPTTLAPLRAAVAEFRRVPEQLRGSLEPLRAVTLPELRLPSPTRELAELVASFNRSLAPLQAMAVSLGHMPRELARAVAPLMAPPVQLPRLAFAMPAPSSTPSRTESRERQTRAPQVTRQTTVNLNLSTPSPKYFMDQLNDPGSEMQKALRSTGERMAG